MQCKYLSLVHNNMFFFIALVNNFLCIKKKVLCNVAQNSVYECKSWIQTDWCEP